MRKTGRILIALVLLAVPAHAGSQLRTLSGQIVPQFASVNMNSANTDHQITLIPWAKYRVRAIIIENCSANLGATSTATLGVFTGAGGTGNTLVTSATIAGLTASTKFVSLTLAANATTDTQTASSIYARVGIAQGSAATCDVSLYVDPLS